MKPTNFYEPACFVQMTTMQKKWAFHRSKLLVTVWTFKGQSAFFSKKKFFFTTLVYFFSKKKVFLNKEYQYFHSILWNDVI